jgi:hypothetical protein
MQHQDCLPYIASGNLIEQFIHKSTGQMAYVGGIEPNSPMPLFAQAIVLGSVECLCLHNSLSQLAGGRVKVD